MTAVSVIIPNYNHELFLQRRIDSLPGMTSLDIEVILIDDCYSDDSRSALASYTKDPRVRNEFNDAHTCRTIGRWKKGVRVARGEHSWIAESPSANDQGGVISQNLGFPRQLICVEVGSQDRDLANLEGFEINPYCRNPLKACHLNGTAS
jgi:hypothetical protein